MDLKDICRTFHPKIAEYTFFSTAYGIFSRIEHMLYHVTSPNKFRKVKVISSIFSDHYDMKLEISYKKENWKKQKHVEAKQNATKQPMGH